MKRNITLLNVVTSIFLQLLTITYGFIIPNLIIHNFGNEVNGLISSITQFLSYISLLEGGVTAVIISKLYKPLVNNNNEEINSIISTSSKFYKKIGVAFFIYTLIFALLCPFIYGNEIFNYTYIFSLTIILSISLIIQYMLSLSLKCLLNADKKVFIISITQSIIMILNIILAILSVIIYPSIHLFKLLTGITYIIQPIIFNLYIRKNYKIIKTKKQNKELLKDRWNGFFNNIAYFIHNSTDIIILTIFTNLVTVSVYSIYTLVTNGIKSLIGAINNAIFPAIGQLYAKEDYNELNKKFDIYEFVYMITIFVIFSVTILLITPFVGLYVGQVNTTKYYEPVFGVLLCIGVMLDLLKTPYMHLSYSANKFKELTIPCFIEAIINILFSIMLVNNFTLSGVAIGTMIALTYRLLFQVWLTKKIINRSPIKFFKKFMIFAFTMVVVIFICKTYIYPLSFTIISWIMYSAIYLIISCALFFMICLLFFKNELNELKKFVLLKLDRKG